MQDLTHSVEQNVDLYRSVLADLEMAISAVREHGLEALEAVLPRLDLWQQQIAGAHAIPAPGVGADDPRGSERTAAARRLAEELVARSAALAELIRQCMGAAGEEMTRTSRSRRYLHSLKNTYAPAAPRVRLQA